MMAVEHSGTKTTLSIHDLGKPHGITPTSGQEGNHPTHHANALWDRTVRVVWDLYGMLGWQTSPSEAFCLSLMPQPKGHASGTNVVLVSLTRLADALLDPPAILALCDLGGLGLQEP